MAKPRSPKVEKEDFGAKVKAHQRYRTEDGEIVPGSTTICGMLSTPALTGWANRLGLEGIDSYAYTREAADIGTLAHGMIEAELKGEEFDTKDFTSNQIERAQWSLESFHEYILEHTLEPILVEQLFVSEAHKYGGTIDLYAELDGRLALLDFKTSKDIYESHKIQVASYAKLLREHGHQVERVMVLKIGRAKGQEVVPHVLSIDELRTAWEIFLHLRAVWSLKKALTA